GGLDEDVRRRDEVEYDLAARRPLPVDDDAFLVGVQVQEGSAGFRIDLIGRKWPPLTGDVASRRLDLDHPRPIVGEQLRAEGPRDPLGQVDNGEGCEGLGPYGCIRHVSSGLPSWFARLASRHTL